METEFVGPDRDTYRMDMAHPHEELEPEEREMEIVRQALQTIVSAGMLSHVEYDQNLFRAFRSAVRESFDIPWTAITPRMQRLIYAINAIHQPPVMIAAGVFCGFTFISNAGAAIGPGKVYDAAHLIGLEINETEAARAARNIKAVAGGPEARILARDAVEFVGSWSHDINLLYLDASAEGKTGKGLYHQILDSARGSLSPGALILAHNSHNARDTLSSYLRTVRGPEFRASVNAVIDSEGLEVSMV